LLKSDCSSGEKQEAVEDSAGTGGKRTKGRSWMGMTDDYI